MRLLAGLTFGLALLAGWPAAASPVLDELKIGKDAQASIEKMQAGDVSGGRKELEALAKAGRTDAAEVLGELLRTGSFGLKADERQACRYFEIAARDRGDGRQNLAVCYEFGGAGRIDLAKAAALYEGSAALGYEKAKCALGNMLMRGRGVKTDVARGVALCTEAAEAGVADAQTDVGNVYLMGKFAPKDAPRAAAWYEKAAAQGQANAAFTLGQMLWYGDGIAQDRDRAAKMWRLAYDGGRKDASFFLGVDAAGRAFERGPPAKVDPQALDAAIGYLEEAEGNSAIDPASRKKATEILKSLRNLKAAVEKRGGS